MATPSVQDLPVDLPSIEPTVSTLPLAIRDFDAVGAERWDDFVQAQPNGSLFMLSRWKRVLEKTFGYKAFYFCVERNGEIAAVAPLFLVSSWLTGRTLISVPFGVYGGISAADMASERFLLKHITNFARERGVEYMELRTRQCPLYDGFHPISRYTTFTSPLSPDSDATLKRLPRDTRYMIRKAQKAGLTAERGWHQLPQFFTLFAQNLQRHGTPAFPISLLTNLQIEFGEKSELLMLYSGKEPVAGVLSFFFKDTVFPYYSGASPEAPRLAANNLLYWEVMQSASQAGYRSFDFGRSKNGTGAYSFKTQWNMTEESLQYQTLLVRRVTAPNYSPTNPMFERATRVWQRLPLWLTTRIGPRVVRWFP
jgi:FemAB-related protein (PEP-CTERM system-associated)